MEPPLPERIQSRLKAVGKSASAASVEAGLGRTALRDILSGRAKSPQLATLVRLTRPLRCTLAYLTGDSDEPAGEGPRWEVEYNPRHVDISDYLEAGTFRTSVWQLKKEDRPLSGGLLFNDLRFVGWDFSLFEMKDNSMRDVHIVAGDRVIAAHNEGVGGTIKLTDGLLVVARFKVDEIDASETSLRQVSIDGDTINLVTRSKGFDSKPIVVGDRLLNPKTQDVNIYKAKPRGFVWIQAVAVDIVRELPIGNMGDYSLKRD